MISTKGFYDQLVKDLYSLYLAQKDMMPNKTFFFFYIFPFLKRQFFFVFIFLEYIFSEIIYKLIIY